MNIPFAIYHHPACLLHEIEDHIEQPDRVDSILVELRKHYKDSYFRLAPLVTHQQILRFHTESHLKYLESLFTKFESSQKKSKKIATIDSDTAIMVHSQEAIYRAAGSVVAAVDDIFSLETGVKKVISAFCAVRPPGHHAESNKACGFCFLNNAGIAAMHAHVNYGVERVAVLDFDVHHGNGTEEGFTSNENLFYGSTHEKDNFPGTGVEPSFKGEGEDCKQEINRRIVNRFLRKGENSKIDFQVKWREIINEMIRFRPGFVIISAGFDAHYDDPLADCVLNESDFEWATMLVIDACKTICPSSPIKCISVLEGGYDLNALAKCAHSHVRTLFDSSLEAQEEALEYAVSHGKYIIENENKITPLSEETSDIIDSLSLDKLQISNNINNESNSSTDNETVNNNNNNNNKDTLIFKNIN